MNIIGLLRSERMRAVVLPGAVTAILVVAVGQRLADLTWALVPSARFEDFPTSIDRDTPSSRAAGAPVPALAEAHLFGEPPIELPIVVPHVDAPKTTLNLDLSGIVSITSAQGQDGSAIIASGRGPARLYRVGQTVEATEATVRWVYPDRVILERSAALEHLSLPRAASAAAVR